MKYTLLALIGLTSLVASMCTGVVHAANPTNKGLYITPLRTYMSVSAGETVTRSFRVANLTDKPMVVTTSLESFSVADYAYEFRFSQPRNDWVQFVEKSFALKPFEGREVPYRLVIPKNAPPGGQYYTLYASANLSDAGTEGTVRAATLLYLTVNGTLTRTSEVVKSSLFPIVVGTQIPYTLDVKNTGNIHYFAYFSASVDGLFYHSASTGESQLLMPGSTRHTKHLVKSPFIPGIYKVSYGFTPDQGPAVRREQYILFLPPWFVVLLTLIAFGAIKYRNRPRASTSTGS